MCFTCFQCLEQERETIPKNENGKYHILTIHDGVHRLLIHDAVTSILKNMIHCPTHASTNPMRNGSALPFSLINRLTMICKLAIHLQIGPMLPHSPQMLVL